ncbi:MAG: efflux RND transporter periplasmic adaptor subunit [Burkholderiales bacterium]|nr:efflux RND transporter periplasmic adaptor subunit [Burkholderiales bacterium]
MKIPISLPRQLLFAASGIVLLIAFGWVATKSGPFAPVKVTVTQAATGEVAPALFGIGTVEARRAYLLGPTTAGRVRRVLVDVGETVKAGQLLAEMDPVDLDARLASAGAAVARAKSAVDTAQAQVRDAKSRLDLASGEARRYDDLGRKGYVSQSVVDAKLQQQVSAQAQLAAADSSLASTRQDTSRLEAERSAASQQRSNIRLLAPADGVVTSRDAEPGSTVVAGQAVLKLMDPASLWIKVRLDQGRSSGLRLGLPADITLRSRPGVSLAGKVGRVEPVSDSVTEERIAQVTFDTLPQGLSAGEMAEVTLRLPGVRDALLIPNAALRQRGAKSGVWLRENGSLRFTPVKTGAESLDGKVQIIEGLKAGDEVIVYSERDLEDDSSIKVVTSLVGKAQ